MKKIDETVLDQFDEVPIKRWFQHWSVVFGPVVIFAVGVLFRVQHWPFALELMAVGLVLILCRSFIFFFSKKRENLEWIYFLGRISLISVLAANFAFQKMPRSILLGAMLLFGISVMVYILRKKRPEDEHAENHEDDY